MKKFFQTLYSDGGHYRGMLGIGLSIVALFSPYLLAIFGFSFPKYDEIVEKIVEMPYGWLCLPLLIWVFCAYLKRYREFKKLTDPTQRIPLIDVFKEAEKQGLLDSEESEQQLYDALRQAGSDGDLKFWGRARPNLYRGNIPPLFEIPAEKWRGHLQIAKEFDGISGETDNSCYGAYTLSGEQFNHLHISYTDIRKWLGTLPKRNTK